MRRFVGSMTAIVCGVAAVASAQPPPANVVVAEVTELTVQASISLVGTVEPKRRSTISSEVAGLVKDLRVDVGDYVEAGGLICQLKDDTLRLWLAGAESELARLQAALAELEAGTRPEEMRLAAATRDEAETIFKNWAAEKERLDALMAVGTASDKEMRDVLSEYTAAAKRLAQAQARYDLAKAGPRQEVIAQARHAVAGQQAAVNRIQDQIQKTIIRAPFGAYVIAKRTEVGQWMDDGGSVCDVLDLDEVRIRVQVPEDAVSFIRPGDVVPIRIQAIQRTLAGTIRSVVPQADPTARTFPVELIVPNEEHLLMSGMFARVKVRAGAAAARLVVPTDAIVYQGNNETVFVIRELPGGLTAVPMPVRTGLPVGTGVALEVSGLRAGDRVVTRGNERLPGATPVNILHTDPPITTTEPADDPALSG